MRITDNDFSVETWEQRLGLPAPALRTERVEPFVFQTTYPTVFGRLYRRDLGGIRVEDMVIVTANGCESLNALPEGLDWP